MSIETTILEMGDFIKVKKNQKWSKNQQFDYSEGHIFMCKNNNSGVTNYARDFLKSVLFIETKIAD